jgi:hypothetical protein
MKVFLLELTAAHALSSTHWSRQSSSLHMSTSSREPLPSNLRNYAEYYQQQVDKWTQPVPVQEVQDVVLDAETGVHVPRGNSMYGAAPPPRDDDSWKSSVFEFRSPTDWKGEAAAAESAPAEVVTDTPFNTAAQQQSRQHFASSSSSSSGGVKQSFKEARRQELGLSTSADSSQPRVRGRFAAYSVCSSSAASSSSSAGSYYSGTADSSSSSEFVQEPAAAWAAATAAARADYAQDASSVCGRPQAVLHLCAVLQQPTTAAFAELRRAYRREVKLCHPDTLTAGQDAAAAVAKFRKLTDAWDKALPQLQLLGDAEQ